MAKITEVQVELKEVSGTEEPYTGLDK